MADHGRNFCAYLQATSKGADAIETVFIFDPFFAISAQHHPAVLAVDVRRGVDHAHAP
jgi:hypothetical protein